MAPPFCLLADPWIPVLRADGSQELIRPADITSGISTNPVVAPSWGRADFDAATREFWIGLLAAACGGEAERGWLRWFRAPPSPHDLEEAFAPLAQAFRLDGEGPRFGQDLEDLVGEEVPVSQLLIEAPGANTVRRNLDHFVRRGGVRTLSRAGAAIALFTLQTYAPSGGAGNRVSVRGGGPLTTLLIPGPPGGKALRAQVPLWLTLWLATPSWEERPAPDRVFPWLAPTRVSDKGKTTTDHDVDPLQAFWGMPRRIRLVFESNPDGRRCDITGRVDAVVSRAYRTRPHGTSYVAFRHPLSPHYRAKERDPMWLPVHGQPGRVGYRHWVGLVANDAGAGMLRQAAGAVTLGYRRLGALGPASLSGTRLLAAGYDMDNMKAREFIESELPLHLVEKRVFGEFDRTVRNLIAGASEAEGITRFFVRQALFVKRTQTQDGFTKAPKDGGSLDLARARFWERTEAIFDAKLEALSDALSTAAPDTLLARQDAARDWLSILRSIAVSLFDELVPLDSLDVLNERSARARIEARSELYGALAGYGKVGQRLLMALDLPEPQPRANGGKA